MTKLLLFLPYNSSDNSDTKLTVIFWVCTNGDTGTVHVIFNYNPCLKWGFGDETVSKLVTPITQV